MPPHLQPIQVHPASPVGRGGISIFLVGVGREAGLGLSSARSWAIFTLIPHPTVATLPRAPSADACAAQFPLPPPHWEEAAATCTRSTVPLQAQLSGAG